ncbi:MAG: DUF4435 domain-containing protein [Gammaproteobacteria bacterium]|nr:DUF4435 domain-containing protein [Gammaproteobacteria bacterium]
MSAIRDEINGNTLANQVRLERAAHQRAFLLLEGSGDALLFRKFRDVQTSSVVVCLGRENLLEAITILEMSGFGGAIGVADRDFSEFVGYPEWEGTVFFSDENDIEIMILCSPALENVVREFGNDDRIDAFQQATGRRVSESIFEEASFMGAFRLLSQHRGWSCEFSSMRWRFSNGNFFAIDRHRMVQQILQRSVTDTDAAAADVVELIKEKVAASTKRREICCGHDCVRILGRALYKKLGSTNQFCSEKGARELAKILRLSYEYEFFKSTILYKSIVDWQTKSGYRILQ